MILTEHTCVSCSNVFSGRYCNMCGEKVYGQHDKSVGHLLEEAFHFVTHFEGKMALTVKTVFLHPGKLSLDYCNGIRKKYFKPISLFLFLVVIYLIFPFFRGLNVNLVDHFGNGYYGHYALQKVKTVMAHHNWTMEETSVRFHAVSEKVSKFLLFIIIPVMALFNMALLRRKSRLFFDHFIFTTEIASFFLMWGFVLLPLLVGLTIQIAKVFHWSLSLDNEVYTSFFVLVPFYLCTYKAVRVFYGLRKFHALLFSLLYLCVFNLFLLMVYRELLFFISISLVH